MIAQGVDFIFLPPREEKPLIPAVMDAKKAGIPVLLVDRNVDQSLAKPGEDYRRLHRLELRPGRPARRRLDDQADRRQGQDHRARRHHRRFAGQRPQEGLRRHDQGQGARHGDRRQPVRRLRPRQGPPGRRDAAAGASGRHRSSTPTTTKWRSARSPRSRRPARSRARTSSSSRSTARRTRCRRSSTASWAARASATRASGRRRSTSSYKYANGETIPPMIINPDHFFDASNAKEALPTAY